MLNPESPGLYTAALTPPAGMRFHSAIGTAFSMDPSFLLQVPVHLAMSAMNDGDRPDPVAVLESVRRYADAITVYVQRGRIQVPRAASPVYGLLEGMTVEVLPPEGVFHPKVWALRFVGRDPEDIICRLMILTKNMTADPSWDVALVLEGKPVDRIPSNRALARFFRNLPNLAQNGVDAGRKRQACACADELYRVKWELPEGFDEVNFYLPKEKEFRLNLPAVDRFAVISPFCSEKTLCALADRSRRKGMLVSRPETLEALSAHTRARFECCRYLSGDAVSGVPDSDMVRSSGLHAKFYLFENFYYQSYTHVVVGSANATVNGLGRDFSENGSGKNVEILVGLKGKTSQVGGIDDLLGNGNDEGVLGRFLTDFEESGTCEENQERKEAEDVLEEARHVLAGADMVLECRAADEAEKWTLTLRGIPPLPPRVVHASAWPIGDVSGQSESILHGKAGAVCLGTFSAEAVTGFTAFELKTRNPEVSLHFVLQLTVENLPEEERNAAITQSVIDNREKFLRYLLLLLAGDDAASGRGPSQSAFSARWLHRMAAGENVALLEEMVRIYSREPEKLEHVGNLLKELTRKNKKNVVPEDFIELWQVFEAALGERYE